MKKILLVASSLDGYIAQSREQIATAWTSPEDRQWFAHTSKKIGVLIMGRQTYETIGKPLPERKTIVMTRDETFKASPLSQFSLSDQTNLYRASGQTPAELLSFLTEKKVPQVAICGGAQIYQTFLQAGLVDEIYLTLEAVFLRQGIKLFSSPTKQVFEPLKAKILAKIELSAQTTVYHLKI